MIYFCILLSFFIAISIAQSCIEDWADFKVSKGGTDYLTIEPDKDRVVVKPKLLVNNVDVAAKIASLESLVTSMQATITSLTAKVTKVETDVKAKANKVSVFTAWGTPNCPGGAKSKKLFNGFVAGKHFEHGGGGASYRCLTTNPVPTGYATSTASDSRAIMYQAEFQMTGADPLANLYDREVACASCEYEAAEIQMFIGWTTCPGTGWTKIYDGWLVAERYSHSTKDYECMQKAPSVVGSATSHNGALFYLVEIRTTKAANDPLAVYPQFAELKCVVCAKE